MFGTNLDETVLLWATTVHSPLNQRTRVCLYDLLVLLLPVLLVQSVQEWISGELLLEADKDASEYYPENHPVHPENVNTSCYFVCVTCKSISPEITLQIYCYKETSNFVHMATESRKFPMDKKYWISAVEDSNHCMYEPADRQYHNWYILPVMWTKHQ